jgi:hypothetical protein
MNSSSIAIAWLVSALGQSYPHAAPGVTSLTRQDLKYTVPAEHFAVLRRGDVTAIVVDNSAIDTPELPGHRAGYNGVASLTHKAQPRNLFVGAVAGLNFEHIHDGTLSVSELKFAPRVAPMELRRIDEHTVELHQAPVDPWRLESCGRYHLLPDGVIEYSFECIPRADKFTQGYLGLFWASYIESPADKAIFFHGRKASEQQGSSLLRGETPSHGVNATHPPAGPLPELNLHPEFPLTLVTGRSPYVYTQPWYYGVSHGMAFVQMFRPQDRMWIAQSPTGGGATNPAWDFQWFVPDYEVGRAYGFVMRAAYVPFESRKQVERVTEEHRQHLQRRGEDSSKREDPRLLNSAAEAQEAFEFRSQPF